MHRYGVVVLAVAAAALLVVGLSDLTEEAISAAMSFGDEVTALKISFDDQEEAEADETLRRRWAEWGPNVPMVNLRSSHRSLGRPIVDYLRTLEAEETRRRIVVLIAEIQPARWCQWILHNQRGVVLDRAIKQGNDVVVCRLRYRLNTWSDRF